MLNVQPRVSCLLGKDRSVLSCSKHFARTQVTHTLLSPPTPQLTNAFPTLSFTPRNGTDGAHKDPSGLHLLQPLHETLGNSASCDKKIHNSIYVAEGHGSSSLEPSRCFPSYGSPGKMNPTTLAYAQAM